ncbi:MAG: alpha-L-fucosidase [Candidatus Hydrogenedentes bacterium]|nr:alpha-L-fucosidase [Candidatus Hydrogenedentota bacterium]
MRYYHLLPIISIILITLLIHFNSLSQDFTKETLEQKSQRLKWWSESKFGLFIHWGLYAIPAGKWGDKNHYGEWIRHEAQIPLEEYKKLLSKFNPVEFNAEEWVQLAKKAGMKYIVITSKHHDGFCLFDSNYTDWDVMSTPFKRDILKELSEACKKEGIKLCFYYSIMDWHHSDYLPRREWEKELRPETGADFNRYVEYMKNQVKELINNYGPLGVLWFDGQWENTWTFEKGLNLYNYVRSLQPDIIINNRVHSNNIESKDTKVFPIGDFATPEQTIPDKDIPKGYWETCMTMNKHWGYNEADIMYKSTKVLIQMLIDIVSKGGNFLLNIGPMANGKFPPQSVERLVQIGEWMKTNGEAIYATNASPLGKPSWGRYTVKYLPDKTILYLHIFDYQPRQKIEVSVETKPTKVYTLLDKGVKVPVKLKNKKLIVSLPPINNPDPNATVIALEFSENPFNK